MKNTDVKGSYDYLKKNKSAYFLKKERNGVKTLCANPAVAPRGSQITSGRGMSIAANVLQGCRGPRTAAGHTSTAPPLPPHSVPATLAGVR